MRYKFFYFVEQKLILFIKTYPFLVFIIILKGDLTMEKEELFRDPACAACGLETSDRICANAKGKSFKNCPTLTR